MWLRRSALGHRDRPRRLRRPAALRARRSSWPGRCPPARPSRRRLLVVRSGGRGRLCVWRRNALALRVSWLSYTYIVQLLSDGALKSHAARPCDTDSALPCSAATHTVPRAGRSRRGEVMEGCVGELAGRSKGLICLRVTQMEDRGGKRPTSFVSLLGPSTWTLSSACISRRRVKVL